ncbi:MAG TPA: cytochrome c [Phenylobacterium sp.]|uniref:c-type cytochrome n=1 Tax=Phenylobacterium sp. TaxID=1871053 RepID=UPI002CDF702D|nr:cytochrome c [Phenylobacterium sp.]HSV03277.1 cytochrome c [Phenylobacterium sp.]
MKRALIIAVALAAAGCDEMVRQPKAPVYGRSDLFPNGAAMQTPPPGAVSREDAAYQAALGQRPPMTLALLQRGRERYDIYCEPCHGLAGDGKGVVPSRGFPQPPDFHRPPLLGAPSRLIVDTITNGYGVMFSYADRVPPTDRWAIAAYVRALQLSQAAPAARLSSDDRARLEAAHGG